MKHHIGNHGLWHGGPAAPRAFTLIETGVGVAAIGAVLLFILPAVGGIARSSKDSRCLNNLARIGYANAVYAAQDATNAALPVHRRQFIGNEHPYDPTFIGAYAFGGKSGLGEQVTDGELWTARWGSMAGLGPATRPLNRILYGDVFTDHTDDPGKDQKHWIEDASLDLALNRCPSDSGYTGVHSPAFRDEKRTAYEHFGTSYAANVFMVSSSLPGCMFSNSPYLRAMDEVLSPSKTLAYQENNGRFAWAAFPNECSFIDGIPGTVRGWHGKDWTFNAAFIDGHADAIYMERYQPEFLATYPPFPTNQQCPCDPPTCDPEYVEASFGVYQCVIVRGADWKKDTLPRAVGATGLINVGKTLASYEGGIE